MTSTSVTRWPAFLCGATVGALVAVLFAVNSGVAEQPHPPVESIEQDTRSAVQELRESVERLSIAVRSLPPHRDTVERGSVATEDEDGTRARLDKIESLLEDLSDKVAGIPELSALEFDVSQAPAKSQVTESIRVAATRSTRDEEATAKEHVLLPMREMLQRYGRPDSVSGSGYGQAQWFWETDDGYTLEAVFSSGRVNWVRGGVPQK